MKSVVSIVALLAFAVIFSARKPLDSTQSHPFGDLIFAY
jgi:hypothetical protein